MIEISKNSKGLYRRIQIAKEELKHTKNLDEKIALYNYLGNIYDAISITDDKKLCLSYNDIYGSYKFYKKFIKKLDMFEEQVIDNFILNKEFISGYISKIAIGIEKTNLCDISCNIGTYQELSMGDYNDVFFQFMQSIKLEEFYEKFLKNSNIYNYKLNEKSEALGFTIYDPLNRNVDIFIGDFFPDILSLFTLAHEMGHVYDLNYFNKDIKSFNSYFYQSFYGEVCSKLFERLFINFMIDNNILIEDAKEKLLDTESDNHNIIVACYMLSLLDDYYLKESNYLCLDNDDFYDLIKNKFKPEIKEVIDTFKDIDLVENFTYAFGDIISMFLFDSINKYGFSNELIDEFVKERDKMFSREFIEDNGMSADNYMELYKKELKLIKK